MAGKASPRISESTRACGGAGSLGREIAVPRTRHRCSHCSDRFGRWRLGYDGKGQFRIKSAADIDAAWAALGAQAERVGLILEAFVPFEREVSVVAVRGRDGEFRAYPLTENWHESGILSASLAPADTDATLAQSAVTAARLVAESLDYVGVFALELFVRNGQLLANEMAPRVHNSGHWTIEGADVSQFENHLRAVLGLPLGSIDARGRSCMLNWIGEMPDRRAVLANVAQQQRDSAATLGQLQGGVDGNQLAL